MTDTEYEPSTYIHITDRGYKQYTSFERWSCGLFAGRYFGTDLREHGFPYRPGAYIQIADERKAFEQWKVALEEERLVRAWYTPDNVGCLIKDDQTGRGTLEHAAKYGWQISPPDLEAVSVPEHSFHQQAIDLAVTYLTSLCERGIHFEWKDGALWLLDAARVSRAST